MRLKLLVCGLGLLLIGSLHSALAADDAGSDAFAVRTEALMARFSKGPPKSIVSYAKSPPGALAVMQWRLLCDLGESGRADPETSATLAWLLKDKVALELFVTSGDPAGGSWSSALAVLSKIIEQEKQAKDGLSLRIALATALSFAQPVAAMADGKSIDPIARHAAFVQWDKAGVLFATFRDLSVWELRYVVGSWSTDSELEWARANIKTELRMRDKVGEGAHMVKYADVNSNGVSVQRGKEFYDNKPMTMAIMLEYGGVCGAISRFGTSMSQAIGVPAMPVGQPGHCAFLWQKNPHEWVLNNDVSGMDLSTCHDGITMPWGRGAWCVLLMQAAQSDRGGFVRSENLRAAAKLAPLAARTKVLERACDESPMNYAAWHDCVTAVKASGTPAECESLAAAVTSAFAKCALARDLLIAPLVAAPSR